MERIVIQIPIKSSLSERLPGKNFINLRGKPLCHHLLYELVKVKEAISDIDIIIDSDSELIHKRLRKFNFKNHIRAEWLAGKEANGNHLLSNFAVFNPDYDIYIQMFVTAVNLKAETIINIIEDFRTLKQASALIGQYETGFYWQGHDPVNYDPFRPDGLSRSQDIQLFRESTGMYLIRKHMLNVTGCRISVDPHRYIISTKEALDIDTQQDLDLAEVWF